MTDRLTNDIWQPMTDKVDIAILGKAAEELNECATVISRILIQGIDAQVPGEDITNRKWLQDEVADVFSTLQHLINRYDLSINDIAARGQKKFKFHKEWHEQLSK